MTQNLCVVVSLVGALLCSACSEDSGSSVPPQSEAQQEQPASSILAPAGDASEVEQITIRRMEELARVKAALDAFWADNGYYPKTDGWYGIGSEWGMDTADWVPGLAPKYIPTLPSDPSNMPKAQYLYASDGISYKIIAHQVDDCNILRNRSPELIDPARDKDGNCWAYGYWNDGGVKW
nr:hypothetical protein [Nitrosomonas nitrosa]